MLGLVEEDSGTEECGTRHCGESRGTRSEGICRALATANVRTIVCLTAAFANSFLQT